MESFAAFLFIFLIFAVGYVLLCVLVGHLASKRGRSSLGWFLFAFFFSPLLGALLVALLGETDAHRHARIIEEETIRRSLYQ